MTVETSPRRTGPAELDATISVRKPSAEVSWVGASSVMVCAALPMLPTGAWLLALAMAVASWSRPMPRAARRSGSASTRTAYFCEPKICAWATPLMVEMAGDSTFWVRESSSVSGTVGEVIDNSRIGMSAGLTFR